MRMRDFCRVTCFGICLAQNFLTSAETIPLRSPEKHKEYSNHKEDVIVLRDGTSIKGSISVLPPITENLPKNIQEIIAVEMLHTQAQMRLVGEKGNLAFCSIPKERIHITQYFPNMERPTHAVTQELDPQVIHYILFRKANKTWVPQEEFSVEKMTPGAEDALFAHLEFEMTRSNVLRHALEKLKTDAEDLQTNAKALQEKYKALKEQKTDPEITGQQNELDELKKQKTALEEANEKMLVRQEELEGIIAELLVALGEERDASCSITEKLETMSDKASVLEENLKAFQQENKVKKVHIVAEGETLNQISKQYYGIATRWPEVYEANRSVIADINELEPGTFLIIPE